MTSCCKRHGKAKVVYNPPASLSVIVIPWAMACPKKCMNAIDMVLFINFGAIPISGFAAAQRGLKASRPGCLRHSVRDPESGHGNLKVLALSAGIVITTNVESSCFWRDSSG